MSRRRWRVLPLLVAGLLAMGWSGAARAQEAGERLVVRKVDTTNFPEVRIQALSVGRTPELGDFVLRENDRIVKDFRLVPVDQTGFRMGVVLVIDISGSMAENNKMSAAKEAATRFVQQKRPEDEMALVTFGDRPTTVVEFTRNPEPLLRAIDELAPVGGTTLYDGVRQGASLFGEQQGSLQANLVVLSDGNDTGSASTLDQAKASVLSARAAVFALGLKGSEFNEGPLRQLAGDSGGLYLSTDDPGSLNVLYDQVRQTLQNQYEIRYTSQAGGQTLDLIVSAGGAQARATTNIGTVAEGIGTAPQVVEPASGPFTGSLGKWLGGALVFAAVALAVYAVARLLVREETTLSQVLRPYHEQGHGGDEEERGVFANATPLLQRAVALTEEVARQRGVLPKVERMLEKADLPLRAAEAILFYVAGAVIVGALVLLLAPSPAFGLLLLAILVLLPPGVLAFLANRRQRKFESQLPDALQLLAGSLRAGYSLLQGVDTVSQEIDDPMGRELRRVIAEARLGRPVEEALEDCADRMESGDFAWAVMAVKIQREVGGNLAELLMTVSDTMLSRERLRRDIKALTAEGRISAIVLGILPVGLALVMYTMNPDYISKLFDETVGNIMLAGSAVLALVGFYWMKKIIEIEI